MKLAVLFTAWTKNMVAQVRPLTVTFGKWVLMHRSLRQFTEHRTLFNLLLARRCGLLKRNFRTSRVHTVATLSNTAIDTAPKARITVWTQRMVVLVMVAIPMSTRWVSMPLCVTRSTVHRTSSNHRQAKHCGSSKLDNPKCLSGRRLDFGRASVNRIAEGCIKTNHS